MMTADQVKARFEAEGVSIAEWARKRGYNLHTVYAVLSGRLKCKRGVCHQIATDLGLKREPRKPQFLPTIDRAA